MVFEKTRHFCFLKKTLEYDANGNLRYERDTNGSVLREFQWDAKNRLVKIIDDSHETHFRYDGLDRRVGIVEKENGVEQSNQVFIWDGTQIVQKRTSDGSTIQRNYFDQGFEEGSNDYYYTKDHLGSIREVVASNGTTVESIYDYSPWGEVTKTGGTGVESDFLYTGHYFHEASDLHLTLYRAYNPELGMWLSRDPIAENGGINLYAYVLNDPINYWDPYGESAFGGALPFAGEAAAADGPLPIGDAIAGGILAGALIYDGIDALLKYLNRNKACDSGCDADGGRNPADDKKLSPKEADREAKKAGYKNAEDAKEQIYGKKNAGKHDLFKGSDGRTYVKPKNGIGPGEPL